MALSEVTGTNRSTPEHAEVGVSRMRRDSNDFWKVKQYLQKYSPFRFAGLDRLVSLSSGVFATTIDKVNCEQVDEIGYEIQKKWDCSNYGEISCKKADQIVTLSHLTNTISVDKDKICIDPSNLIHRLVLVGERNNNVKEFFQYELTAYPMSLFKDNMMRKPDKPSLYRDFAKGLTNATLPTSVQFVVDGGYLIHKVRWHASMDVCTILPLFTKYLHKYGPGVQVVFDGYSSGPSIKDHEHARRVGKVSQAAPDRQIDMYTKQIGLQEPFLSNTNNKMSFITILMQYLSENEIPVFQAQGDADTMIVSVALNSARHCSIAVLAEDTDILALLLFHRKPEMNDIFFVSEPKKGKIGKDVGGKCISINAVQTKIGPQSCQCILVAHAFGGCDTTSAMFGHGKGSIFNKIIKDSMLVANCSTLQSETASVEEVCSAGTQICIALYGGKCGETLAGLRYASYCSSSLSRRFQPERFPPSEGAVSMHAMRAHLQAVIWGTLGETSISPTDWGWKLEGDCFTPIQVRGDIAPEHILQVVRCNCKGYCSSTLCSCRKHGLSCVTACSNCHGTDCINVSVSESDEYVSDSDSDIENVTVAPGDMTDFMLDDNLYFWDEEEI